MNQNLSDLEYALDNIVNVNGNYSGVEFEKSVADLLRVNGFLEVKITPYSGDYGFDIIAKYNNQKYVFQCKYYNNKNLGIKPIQEVFAGKTYYRADVAVVVTNVYFSQNAQILSKKTNVQLWDRSHLSKLLRSARRSQILPWLK